VRRKPRGDRVSGAVRQQVDGAMPFEIAEEGVVARGLTPRPVVDPEHPRGFALREVRGAHEPQEGIGADRHPESRREALSCLPTERECDRCEGVTQTVAAPGAGGDECGQALPKGHAWAAGSRADEAAGVDKQRDGTPGTREIDDAALIAAVDAVAPTMAQRAAR
jgi:hypothetical protein